MIKASLRPERIEAEPFAQNISGTTSFGLAMIRDCHGARAFDTLLRYPGGTLGRALARAAHPQGAPGRARAARGRGACWRGRSRNAEQTQAPRKPWRSGAVH